MSHESPLNGVPSIRIGPCVVGVASHDIREFVGRWPVVSSDDNYLSHGGGVSQAVWQAGHPLVHSSTATAVLDGDERLGLADITTSRTASGTLVLHAITVDFDSGERLTRRMAQVLYGRILDEVADANLRTVVTPLLGSGVVGLAPRESLEALVGALRDRSVLPFGVEVLVLSDDLDITVLASIAGGDPVTYTPPHGEWAARAGTAAGIGQIPPSGPAAIRTVLRRAGALGSESVGVERIDRAGGMPVKGAAESIDADQSQNFSQSLASLARAASLAAPIQAAAERVDAAGPLEIEGAALNLWGALFEGRPQMATAHQSESWFIRAQAARNQLAHGMTTRKSPGLVRDLLRGCRVLLLEDSDDFETASTVEQQFVHAVDSEPPETSGTAHVRRLHELLMGSLSDEEKVREHDRLRELGYRGDLENCILESCVAQDPVDLLVRHFSGHRLAHLLEERDSPAPPAEPTVDLAERLLRELGFPHHGELVDPVKVAKELKTFGSEIHAMNTDQLLGRVTKLSRSFEAVLRTYLQFLCSGLLRVAPDKWLADRAGGSSGPPPTIRRATMGQLVYLVRDVGRQIDASDDPRTRDLVRELTVDGQKLRWLPGKAHDLVSSRNMWVHSSSEATEKTSLASQRRQAEEFADLCSSITDELIRGAYPTPILIESISYDRWGRRRVSASTATSMREELFTNEDLRPGEVYLMLAHTNPLRIDPLLVRTSMGELD